MYITKAKLSKILQWFESSRFHYLLLFAAGNSGSADFIGSLFDQKETVDVVSSSHTAVFLFAPELETSIEFDIGPGSFAFAQGRRLAFEAPPPPSWFLRGGRLPPDTVSVSDFTDSSYRMNVVQASVSATYDITSELGLGPRDIPAWILFQRGNLEPLVVRTVGREEIDDLLRFLKDLWDFDYKSVTAPRARATSRLQRLTRARQHMEDAGRRLDQMLERWREDEGSASIRITRENAIHSTEVSVEENRQMKEIKCQWHKYQSAKNTVCRLEEEISEYRARIAAAPLVLEHNEREADRLAKRYQTRFKMRAVGAKLASFIRAATGVGKQAKDMTDILARLRKEIGADT